MSLSRRAGHAFAGLALVTLLPSQPASAQATYPDRKITLMVGFAPDGKG